MHGKRIPVVHVAALSFRGRRLLAPLSMMHILLWSMLTNKSSGFRKPKRESIKVLGPVVLARGVL